ncbi:MAG: DUF427 domain-containing protein [Gemmatimonadaceae bacterium]
MARAMWKGVTLAESDATRVVEGNHYFPPDAVQWDYFTDSEKQTTCPWKGTASYYDVQVGDEHNRDAAWYYPDPQQATAEITGYIAFWRGVQVQVQVQVQA